MAEKTRAVLKAELKDSEKKKEELQTEKDSLQTEKDGLQREVSRLQSSVDIQRVSLNQMQGDINRKDREKTELQADLDDSLDKSTAEFFMDKILDIVEKISEDC